MCSTSLSTSLDESDTGSDNEPKVAPSQETELSPGHQGFVINGCGALVAVLFCFQSSNVSAI